MSDVYMPGVKSRFNSEKIIEDLMKLERAPKEKAEKNIDDLETRKVWWQDLSRRVTSLRESARMLFSFQNPFNERIALSSHENIITATANREAEEGDYQFTVKQLAQADRLLSPPLDEKMRIEEGTYGFTLGENNGEVSLNFKGGTLREFADAVNRQGRGKLSASLITVQPGTRSILLESKIAGAGNNLSFTGDAATLAESFTAVSTAQDAVISMQGIDMTRPANVIDDIIPGVTITARGVSEQPVRLEIRPDREGIKEAIISLVGNYNRLMAELNVLTRAVPDKTDTRIIDELTYLDKDEIDEMKKRMGAFSGDTTLTQLKANLLRTVSSPYSTDDEYDLSLLAQIGISTNTRPSGGASYNPSRLRGYLEIDPVALDAAMEQNITAIRQLFAHDTNGDLIADTGVAFNLDSLAKPFVEMGGIIPLKTGTLDSRIAQDKRRIDTMERQLAAKEADLKIQYSRMESAYDRMERMSTSLDNFSQRANNNR
jgi:flagellar capping protein FliD